MCVLTHNIQRVVRRRVGGGHMVQQDSPEAHNELMADCNALKYEFCSRATTDKTQIFPTDVQLVSCARLYWCTEF